MNLPSRMEGEGEHRRAEPCASAAQDERAPRPRWRSVVGWLRAEREDLEQEGLLVGRTLRVTPRTRARDENAAVPDAAAQDDAA
jgi:hypothetical protein